MNHHRPNLHRNGGFFRLFDLPPTVLNPRILEELGRVMATARLPGQKIDSGYVYSAGADDGGFVPVFINPARISPGRYQLTLTGAEGASSFQLRFAAPGEGGQQY